MEEKIQLESGNLLLYHGVYPPEGTINILWREYDPHDPKNDKNKTLEYGIINLSNSQLNPPYDKLVLKDYKRQMESKVQESDMTPSELELKLKGLNGK